MNDKVKKQTMIRDSFTCPIKDYEIIDKTRLRLAKHGSIGNKAEVIRAGLIALDGMSDEDLVEIFSRVEKLKPGRK